jgi:hypothetical protein
MDYDATRIRRAFDLSMGETDDVIFDRRKACLCPPWNEDSLNRIPLQVGSLECFGHLFITQNNLGCGCGCGQTYLSQRQQQQPRTRCVIIRERV